MGKPLSNDILSPEALEETRVEFHDNRLLIDLCGEYDRNLTAIETAMGVVILRRGNVLLLQGAPEVRAEAAEVLEALYERLEQNRSLEPADLDAVLRMSPDAAGAAPRGPEPEQAEQLDMFPGGPLEIRTKKRTVEPRSTAQRRYASALFSQELVFGIGPAGTGKTYLAVAVAVSMFLEGRIDKIILSRPAVEAGERLGFLPGTEKEKMDPYMRPLYDALADMLPGKQLGRLMEEGKIEIAPLAFMRGRTLSNAFVVLDEAQNATAMQMKMFLTRLGEGSRMAVTGDPSQIDLPRGTVSGLVEAIKILADVDEIAMVRFTAADVVRHPLVARIIEAYDAAGGGPR